MKPESVKRFGLYQYRGHTVQVVERRGQRFFSCRHIADYAQRETIAADDLLPIPAPCSVLDAGPV